MGSASVAERIRRLAGQPLHVQLPMLAVGERGYGDASTPTLDSAGSPCLHGCLAFLHRLLPPHSLPPHFLHPSLAVNSSPRSGIVPQSLNSSSQFLHLPGDRCPCVGYVSGKDCLILNPFRPPQISCFTLSLKCFSSDSDNFPDVGTEPLLKFAYPPRAGPVLLTLRFFPLVSSSYQVLHDSIYSFPLVKYSCLLSAGVLHGLLCLKMYS